MSCEVTCTSVSSLSVENELVKFILEKGVVIHGFKGELHLKPKLSTFSALSQNYQHCSELKHKQLYA